MVSDNLHDLVPREFRNSLNSHPEATAFMLGLTMERWKFPSAAFGYVDHVGAFSLLQSKSHADDIEQKGS